MGGKGQGGNGRKEKRVDRLRSEDSGVRWVAEKERGQREGRREGGGVSKLGKEGRLEVRRWVISEYVG